MSDRYNADSNPTVSLIPDVTIEVWRNSPLVTSDQSHKYQTYQKDKASRGQLSPRRPVQMGALTHDNLSHAPPLFGKAH